MRCMGNCAGLLLVLAVGGILGCSDDTTGLEPVVPTDLYLMVHVDESYARWSPSGHLFASGPDGEVLAEATWTGPGDVVLANPDVALTSVSLTTVSGDVDDADLELRTQQGIAPRSEYTLALPGYVDDFSSARLRFLHPPAHASYYIGCNGSSGWGYVPMPEINVISIVGDQTDVYLRLNRDRGLPLGCWIRDLSPAELVTVDLDEAGALIPLVRNVLDLPENARRYVWSVTVDHPAGGPPNVVLLDHYEGYGALPSAMVSYLPPPPEGGFNVEVYAEFGEEGERAQWLRTRGAFPSRFGLLPQQVNLVNTHPDSARYSWEGEADRHVLEWYGGHGQVWYVVGPAAGGDGRLPLLPDSVREAMPGLTRESFALSWLLVEVDLGRNSTQTAFWYTYGLEGTGERRNGTDALAAIARMMHPGGVNGVRPWAGSAAAPRTGRNSP